VQHGDKFPHQLKFTKVNLTPTQLYFDVKDGKRERERMRKEKEKEKG